MLNRRRNIRLCFKTDFSSGFYDISSRIFLVSVLFCKVIRSNRTRVLPHVCGVHHSQFMVVVVHHWFGVEERNAFELQQRVVNRVGKEVPDPLGNHNGGHDRQQEHDVVGDFNLQTCACYGNPEANSNNGLISERNSGHRILLFVR